MFPGSFGIIVSDSPVSCVTSFRGDQILILPNIAPSHVPQPVSTYHLAVASAVGSVVGSAVGLAVYAIS